ncbi:MAG: tRNA (adenosine(37)-N6)-threonylcarbamoyltransferase complex ATPase subunit type 1 TsaE [Lachnospiraceae bacterium]|nr:tRNA (adenosine(37)-N6)-threonylcarbamoyltransferase complex ATPase subunit type 1 TsaE [Lachnospiraceae bacterium]
MVYESFSADETKALGEKIAQSAKEGSVFCLSGDLGVGKTVFTKGFAAGLDVDEYITSPTFTIVNEYEGRLKFYHFDVYRITDPDELFDIGFEEYIYGNGVCLIEWAEIVKEDIPDGAIWITIEKDLEKGLDYRRITVEGGTL